MRHAAARGWRALTLNFRSCSGELNRRPQFYHSGHTDDLDHVVGLLLERDADAPIGVVGVSLGGNVLLKWLGERELDAPKQVVGAVAISAPLHLVPCAGVLDRGFRKYVYTASFLTYMRDKVRRKAERDPNFAILVDLELGLRARTFGEYDRAVTARLHGFADEHDYWVRASSGPYLRRIHRPTLLISALDDPLVPPDALPDPSTLPPWVRTEFTPRGGHAGFIDGRWPWRVDSWAERRLHPDPAGARPRRGDRPLGRGQGARRRGRDDPASRRLSTGPGGVPAALLRLVLAGEVRGDARPLERADPVLSRQLLHARPPRLRARAGGALRRGAPDRAGGDREEPARRLVGPRPRARALRARGVRHGCHAPASGDPPLRAPRLVQEPPALAPHSHAPRTGRVRARLRARPDRVRARALVDSRRSPRLDLAPLAARAVRPSREGSLAPVRRDRRRAPGPPALALPRGTPGDGARRGRRLGHGRAPARDAPRAGRARPPGAHRPGARAAGRGPPRLRGGRLPADSRGDRAAPRTDRRARGEPRPARRVPRHALRGGLSRGRPRPRPPLPRPARGAPSPPPF